MKHIVKHLIYFLFIIIFTSSAYAQEEAAIKADKTGTNPVNFTNDFRLYNEYIWLNTRGDGYQNVTTMQYRTPFADGKWQFQAKIRSVGIKADINDDGRDDVDEWGFGDTDLRFLTVPYLNMKKKRALAMGLEVFLPTASEEVLGSERVSLGPQIFAVKFLPFGIPGTLIAPAYQHKFSVYEQSDNDSQQLGLLDLFILWSSPSKQYWALLDPQGVIDYENDIEFGQVDAEAGMMLDKVLGTQGHSIYVRPSIGFGRDRLSDGSIEVGYKIVW
jgi:hypothetical protein